MIDYIVRTPLFAALHDASMEGDDIVFVENVSSTLDHSNHPKEGRVETCKPGEFTRHDRDVPVDAELPVRIDPGFSSLANDCPPLSSPVSSL